MGVEHLYVEAKQEAQAITKRLCITKPEQIELEAISAFYDVYYREDELEGSDARIQVRDDKAIVTVRIDIPEPERKRFGLAHELGHFILHRRQNKTHNCNERDFLRWYKESSEEPQANVFAAELLMPESIFRPLAFEGQVSFQTIKELATTFRTSLTATAFRFVEVAEAPCAIICAQKQRIAWMYWSSNFHHFILPKGSEIDENCYAGVYFKKGIRPAEDAHSVPPIVWLNNPDLVTGYRLYEQAVCMPRYDTVLTLVWVSR